MLRIIDPKCITEGYIGHARWMVEEVSRYEGYPQIVKTAFIPYVNSLVEVNGLRLDISVKNDSSITFRHGDYFSTQEEAVEVAKKMAGTLNSQLCYLIG
jgi:hypothetical protein